MEYFNPKIGVSTGCLFPMEYRDAINFLRHSNISVIEISILRENELHHFAETINELNLYNFKYISIHIPTKLQEYKESDIIGFINKLPNNNWNIIIHPDVITDFSLWLDLRDKLCLENMDKRKTIGRTKVEFDYLFNKLPDASFCLDLAHARQVDPSMLQAKLMLKTFKNKLKQLHISQLNSQSKHETLSIDSILAYNALVPLFTQDFYFIIESPTTTSDLNNELIKTNLIFNTKKLSKILKPFITNYENKPIYLENKFETAYNLIKSKLKRTLNIF